jgi:hypothetical protein
LGQKQTFALQQVMSALPPKADIGAAQINVRFVPIADISPIMLKLVLARSAAATLQE